MPPLINLSFEGSEFCEGHMRFQVQLRFGILGFSQLLKSELERGMNGKMPRGRGKGYSRGMPNLEAIRHFREEMHRVSLQYETLTTSSHDLYITTDHRYQCIPPNNVTVRTPCGDYT